MAKILVMIQAKSIRKIKIDVCISFIKFSTLLHHEGEGLKKKNISTLDLKNNSPFDKGNWFLRLV